MPPPHKPIPAPGRANWRRMEEIIERFEEAWQNGERPSIDTYLQVDDLERGSLVVELVHTDLECCLKAGEPARIERYFERYPELASDRGQALGLIAAEYNLRRRCEPGLTPDEYGHRFPQYRDELAARLRAAPPRPEPSLTLTRCPRCQSPLDPAENPAPGQASCPSCGSTFRVDPAQPLAWSPEKLTRLGRFVQLEMIGRGAFGTVYRARDAQLDRVVAVKVPRGGRWVSRSEVERFTREARSAARLSHPGIVPVYDVGQSETLPYIVTALVQGQTLAQALAGRRFGFREAADLVAQVALALEHAHGHGVIHRDLKPSNILLGHLEGARAGPGEAPEPRAFVTDFGLAWRDDGDVTVTVEGQILGTPAYMSPEQARGQSSQADGRSDVYSLGVILYELLTGEVPFRGLARMVLRQIQYDEPRPPRQLNDRIARDLETITLKCLAKEPGRRYATAGELAADLRRHLNGEPIRARPVGPLEQAWRWAKRNRRVAGLSAAVALLLLLLALGSTLAAVLIGRQRDAEAEARAQAVGARAEAEDSARLARTAQHRAQENEVLAGQQRDLATDSLNTFVFDVQARLEDQPGVHELRKDLLNTALAALQRVAHDPHARPDRAAITAHRLLGDIQLALGQTVEARQQYERGLAVAEKLAAEEPMKVRARRDLAVCLGSLGNLSLRTGDAAAARSFNEKALLLNQALGKDLPQDHVLQHDLALAYLRLGDARVQLGETAAARDAYAEALKLSEALVAADPTTPRHRHELVVSHYMLGSVAQQFGDEAAARDHYRKALQQAEEMVRADPLGISARRQVLISCRHLGDLYMKKREEDPARQLYRRAHDLGQELVKADPLNSPLRLESAVCCEKLGEVQQRLHDLPGAQDWYREALKQYEELAAADPRNARVRRAVANGHERVGVISRLLGDYPAARAQLRQVVERRQSLASANPENIPAQAELAAAHANLGMVEMDATDFPAAAGHFERGLVLLEPLDAKGRLKDQAQYQGWLRGIQSNRLLSKAAQRAVEDLDFALARPPEQVPDLLRHRARALALRGRHADAAATAERLRALDPSNRLNLFHAACCYGLCVRGVAPDKQPDQLSAEEAAARADYANRAVTFLAEAVQHGFTNWPAAEANPSLATVRHLEGFRKLVERMKAARRPAAPEG